MLHELTWSGNPHYSGEVVMVGVLVVGGKRNKSFLAKPNKGSEDGPAGLVIQMVSKQKAPNPAATSQKRGLWAACPGGFEPPAFGSASRCSVRLSYGQKETADRVPPYRIGTHTRHPPGKRSYPSHSHEVFMDTVCTRFNFPARVLFAGSSRGR